MEKARGGGKGVGIVDWMVTRCGKIATVGSHGFTYSCHVQPRRSARFREWASPSLSPSIDRHNALPLTPATFTIDGTMPFNAAYVSFVLYWLPPITLKEKERMLADTCWEGRWIMCTHLVILPYLFDSNQALLGSNRQSTTTCSIVLLFQKFAKSI